MVELLNKVLVQQALGKACPKRSLLGELLLSAVPLIQTLSLWLAQPPCSLRPAEPFILIAFASVRVLAVTQALEKTCLHCRTNAPFR